MLYLRTRYLVFLLIPLVLNATLTFATDEDGQAVRSDNSAMNRSRGITAQDQARGSGYDVEITRKIRRHVVSDKDLSVYAHNIKIVTIKGVVTLSGPVRTEAEKNKIEDYARLLVRSKNIRNDLSVAEATAAR